MIQRDINKIQTIIFLQRLYAYLLALCLLLLIPPSSFASDANYIYDDIGRLIKVVSETGEVATYNYDAVGNLLPITTTSTTDSVAIVDIDPWEGSEGTIVTIYGKGFSDISGQNIISFNGIPASVTSSTSNTIITSVPAGAITGRVSVQTPLGSAMSLKDFTVQQPINIIINPSFAFLTSGKSKQFTATVTGTTNTSVIWSVEGIEGGTPTIGTINTDGLYTAPSNTERITEVSITARSVDDSSMSAEAKIYLNVERAISNSVSVAFEPQPQQPIPIGPILSPAVSIFVEQQPQQLIQIGPVLSPAVSIIVESQSQQPIQIGPILAPYVSIAVGPYISSINPKTNMQGSNFTMTITGIGFSGASAVDFYLNGAVDPDITASNIQVNPEGTQITADVFVSPAATSGIRFVRVTALSGTSQGYYAEGNIFTITTP